MPWKCIVLIFLTSACLHSAQEDERIAKKFYGALALHDYVNEVSMEDVVAKYGLTHKGPLQDLQVSSCASSLPSVGA